MAVCARERTSLCVFIWTFVPHCYYFTIWRKWQLFLQKIQASCEDLKKIKRLYISQLVQIVQCNFPRGLNLPLYVCVCLPPVKLWIWARSGVCCIRVLRIRGGLTDKGAVTFGWCCSSFCVEQKELELMLDRPVGRVDGWKQRGHFFK